MKWKSLDIVSSQGKVGPFRIVSEKTKQKAKWKQESKTTTMLLTNFRQMFIFYTPWKRQKPCCFWCILGVKKGNIDLKWVDNSGREIISIRNKATLIDSINGKNTTSTSASNNVMNGVTIFISEKFKGSCEWYFKSDIAEFELDYMNKIKLKTFIDKIRSLTKFSIFFSSSFKRLMTWSIDGRKTWRVWKSYFWHRFIDWW